MSLSKGDLELIATTVSVVLIVGVVVLSISSLFSVTQLSLVSGGRLLSSPELEIYQDEGLTTKAIFIDWDLVEPDSQTNRTVWVKSLTPATVHLTTQNWQPANATEFISVVWYLEGAQMKSQEVREATLTLVVAANVTGITEFSFDIVITAVS